MLDLVHQGNLRGRGIVMGAGADSAAIERSASTHFAGLPRGGRRGAGLRCSAANAVVADSRSTDAPGTASIGSSSSPPL